MKPKLKELSHKEKRMLCAKVDGFRDIDLDGDCWLSGLSPSSRNRDERIREGIPYYGSCLNAMHEVVMTQPAKVRKAMRFHLYEICGQMEAHNATATQRLDALLLAKELAE